MGKKRKKDIPVDANDADAIVDIDGDILRNKEEYTTDDASDTKKGDAGKLSDMMREYDQIRDSLKKQPEHEHEEKEKGMGNLKNPNEEYGVESLHLDDEPTTKDVVLGIVGTGVVVIGVVALCVAGVKGFNAIKKLL